MILDLIEDCMNGTEYDQEQHDLLAQYAEDYGYCLLSEALESGNEDCIREMLSDFLEEHRGQSSYYNEIDDFIWEHDWAMPNK